VLRIYVIREVLLVKLELFVIPVREIEKNGVFFNSFLFL
jgi:hypothetical protein